MFAWRTPGEVRFCEVKAGLDRITASPRRFLEVALAFHGLEEFTVITVGALPGRRGPARAGRDPLLPARRDRDGTVSVRHAGRTLLRALAGAAGPDDPQTRQVLHDVMTAIQARTQT